MPNIWLIVIAFIIAFSMLALVFAANRTEFYKKLQELKGLGFKAVDGGLTPGTYCWFNDPYDNTLHLTVCNETHCIYYKYDDQERQLSVNYEAHETADH